MAKVRNGPPLFKSLTKPESPSLGDSSAPPLLHQVSVPRRIAGWTWVWGRDVALSAPNWYHHLSLPLGPCLQGAQEWKPLEGLKVWLDQGHSEPVAETWAAPILAKSLSTLDTIQTKE